MKRRYVILIVIAAVLVTTIGGVLLGFTFGMIDMYNKTMDGLGLIEGGILGYLDMETLRHVAGLMTGIVSKIGIFGIFGLVCICISIGILIALNIYSKKVM